MDEEPSTRLFPGGGTFLISTLIPSKFRTDRTALSLVLRIPLVLHICKGCSNPEYACICDH